MSCAEADKPWSSMKLQLHLTLEVHDCLLASNFSHQTPTEPLPPSHHSLLQAHEMALAEPFASRLSTFQRLLVLRCLRPDKVLAGARLFVGEVLGKRFVEPPPFDLATCFRESGPATPLVFVLSPGGWRAVDSLLGARLPY